VAIHARRAALRVVIGRGVARQDEHWDLPQGAIGAQGGAEIVAASSRQGGICEHHIGAIAACGG
jgi:hypothetical protein